MSNNPYGCHPGMWDAMSPGERDEAARDYNNHQSALAYKNIGPGDCKANFPPCLPPGWDDDDDEEQFSDERGIPR